MATGSFACMNWLATAGAAVGVAGADLAEGAKHAPENYRQRVRALQESARGIEEDIRNLRRQIAHEGRKG